MSFRKIAALFGALLLLAAGAANAVVCSVGDKADVLWKGTWYPAHVTKVNEDQTRCFIRYDGYGSEWDEWVGQDRIRIKGVSSPAPSSTQFKVGDEVQVNWKGSWYPASVLSVRNGKYRIHYDGYSSSWDEWVGPNRIRAR